MVSFNIAGVDAKDLINKYQKGETLIEVSESKDIQSTPYNVKDVKLEEYEVNQKRFMVGISNKYEEVAEFKNFNCMYCLKETSKEYMLGIPICRENVNGQTIYNTIDAFCSFPCVYSELLSRSSKGIYSTSLYLLKEMFTQICQTQYNELQPAPDRRLLKIFNGPLDYEKFHKEENPIFRNQTHIHLVNATEYFSL